MKLTAHLSVKLTYQLTAKLTDQLSAKLTGPPLLGAVDSATPSLPLGATPDPLRGKQTEKTRSKHRREHLEEIQKVARDDVPEIYREKSRTEPEKYGRKSKKKKRKKR